VAAARDRQRARLEGTAFGCNAHMPGAMARRDARLTASAERVLSDAVEAMALSGRGFDRVVKVARTIADLAGAARVDEPHVLEALQFRPEPAREEVAALG